MKIFIFEFICGGGMAGEDLTSDLAVQGGAMLQAVVEDFCAAGFDVHTSLDHRLDLALSAARVLHIESQGDLESKVRHHVDQADAALVIAPEFDGILESWSRRLDQSRARNLGSHADAVSACADKLKLAAHLTKAGIPTPSTEALTSQGGTGEAPKMFNGPMVIKPRFGAGCEDTFLCLDRSSMDTQPADIERIVQPLVWGQSASVSFLVNGNEKRTLLAGNQNVRQTKYPDPGLAPLKYLGGMLPLDPNQSARAIALGKMAIGAVPGLNGFVGVDLILSEDPDFDQVIEINPRMTVSFVALRQLCRSSLANAIIHPDAPSLEWASDRIVFDESGRARSQVS